jgi:hypothetical protein
LCFLGFGLLAAFQTLFKLKSCLNFKMVQIQNLFSF